MKRLDGRKFGIVLADGVWSNQNYVNTQKNYS